MVERESPTRGQEQILRVVWEDIRRRLLFGAAWWSKAVLKKWASPDAASINFAAKAKDLQEIRDAMVTAAGVSAGLWLSYLFVLFYFLVAAGGVTHKDLFLENAVKLPFLNIDLPLRGFFWLGPLIFLVVHTYVLLHFRLLAVKVRIFDNELHAQIDSGQEDSVTRTSLRYQLPNDIFVQFLAGARETRTGLTGWLLEGIAWISLVIGPVALLVFFQLQFLPYHEVRITWLQRVVVWLDLLLLWRIWSEIVPSAATTFTLSVVTLITLYVVFLIATFPGEWLEIPAIPGRKDLVAGDVNLVTRKPDSFWSNRLVLPGFDVIDHSKFDNEAKIGVLPVTASLRARNLRGAVLIGAVLRKVDFTAADLQGAWLDGAQLQGTSLDEAQLQGASLDRANLQGAHLIGANLTSATLIDADLTVLRSALSGEDQRIGVGAERRESEWKADLSGANLTAANLDGAHLDSSALIYADMTQADLTGATLEKADLTGANLIYTRFNNAHLDETIMNKVCLAGASLPNAILKKAHLIRAELFSPDQQKNGDDLTDADLTGADLTNANLAHALFGESDFKQANLAHANLNGAHLSQARHVSEEQLKEGCGKTDDLPSGLNLGTCSTPQNDPDEGRGPEQAAARFASPLSWQRTITFSRWFRRAPITPSLIRPAMAARRPRRN